MLDSHSLDTIAKLKQRLFQGNRTVQVPTLALSNRGKKLPETQNNHLQPQLVAYDNTAQVVYTNSRISKSTLRHRRRWQSRHAAPEAASSDGELSDLESDADHPLEAMRISDILAPLTHPAELVTHAAILKTYKLAVYADMANDLIHLIEVEQNNLNWLNKLLQVLNGEEWSLVLETHMGLPPYDHGLDEDRKKRDEGEQKSEQNQKKNEDPSTMPDQDDASDPFFAVPAAFRRYEALQAGPDDEVRQELTNYLQVSIQRQYEYIKNLTQLRNGLVRADRLKLDLLKWAREMHDKKT